ncbi:CarboxypepD_reg-like domain-containing protein [Tenacibaculum sp. MAR_2009_124]|uniref:carboxypeptidase-like regulatory domain-containing protein n=1 Tax=Tenacibaculum sp. MAR_2009_124 TaxID=1250059 RepID=UPI000899342C|nr:carboxypeptidase-like regulatory domain-containing protein [Tenacibaculum sp. MAR_2009_124]SEB45581.1 CarboxypepD_reg-like domain-containing protein [Tenacibaculum sp. MAR_2009_124]
MKNVLTYIVIFCSLHAFSQINQKLIKGKILNRLGSLSDVHIVNTTSNQATYSNDDGDFEIPAKPNDLLRLSYVGYETKFVIIEKKNLSIQKNVFVIEKTTYTLDEIKLRRHNLIGTITTDIKETPVNYKDNALMETMDLSEIDMRILDGDDYIDKNVRPDVVKSDPTTLFEGVGTAVNMPFGNSKKLWNLRKELAFKKGMPAKLMKELGAKFFFIDLGIPPEKYYHFLEYCNPLGIENHYKKGEKLEVIKILQNESKSYSEVINEHK